MMKELYLKPTAYIEEFKTVDVITTSINDIKPDDNIVDGSNGWYWWARYNALLSACDRK